MSDWQPPGSLPDLRRVGLLAIDIETNDEGLRAELGSAWPWHGGYICGVSVAYRADDGIRAHYFPLRHPETNNFDPAQVFAWLKDLVASNVRFITQNGLYDWGWIRADAGIKMPSADRLEEVGALATLVDENRFAYGLDALCAWRGLPGKDESLLEQAVRTAGLAPKRKKLNIQSHIWQVPAQYVGPYAEADARSTLALGESLDPILDREGTRDAYRLEIDLLPMVHEMRRRGLRINQNAAERARDLLLQKRDAALAELSEKLDAAVSMDEINRSTWKAQTFDAHHISYPRTAKGNPSFKAGKLGWMTRHAHWLPQLIATANKYNDAGSKFLEGHILEHLINGRIYAEIHPHRGDDGSGTRSLRFSYSDPPLQQMPSRDKELGPLIRSVFLPEDGEIWCKPDLSQQEFRFVVHYAVLRNLARAKEAAELYRTNPDADFHALVADMTGLEREAAKAVNFAKIYGAGVKKFAEMIGKPLHEAQIIYAQYDRKMPFLRRLSTICQNEAKRLGFTELYDGARRHWDYWEAPYVFAKGAGPCPLEEAKRRRLDPEHPWHGRGLRRSKTNTALNALIQGSAARHTKLWMRACWREGIVPLVQMHDALECSVTTREQGELIARLGCEAVQLEVPMRVDLKFGRNWGDAKHTWDALMGGAVDPKPVVAAAPVASINGTELHTETLAAKPAIELPAAPPSNANEAQIPLADLIDEPVPRNGLIRCRFHDDSTPSLKIYDDHFHCFACDAHGDHVDWLMMVEGLDRDEAIHVLETWEGPVTPRKPAGDDEDEKRKRDYALRLWKAAKPIAGTLAARYLADTRRIDLAALPTSIDEVLRFHPRCPFGPGNRHPCLLALMRDATTDAPTGIHRIALAPDAHKIERRMLGRSGIVKLWPAGLQLVVGEGIETVLAAATRISHNGAPLRPAWSAVSAPALKRFPIIPGVERLIILVDHDLNGEGQAAAEACRHQWAQAGRTGCLLLPERPGADFNDVALEMLEHTS